MSKLISIIVPVFNEQVNVKLAYNAIVEEFKHIKGFNYEIIFTDNHSTDSTFQELTKIATQNPRVKVFRFVRNFGFQNSILTGYRHARGDAAIQIDCDLQDPPSLFKEFISLWQKGHDVVIGLRNRRVENRVMIFLRDIYYKLLDKISDTPHAINAGDFRLVDRHILNQLRQINEAHPYVRGLISELAKNQIGINYERKAREYGKSKFPIVQLFRLAFDGIYTHSIVPLRIASYFGMLVSTAMLLLIAFYLGMRFFYGRTWPVGFATTTLLILFSISLNALFLGIIGEYIGRIYNQIRARPRVVIEKTINVESKSFTPVYELEDEF